MIVGYIKRASIPTKFIDKIKYYLKIPIIEQIDETYVIHINVNQKKLIYMKENEISFQINEENNSKEIRKEDKTQRKIKKQMEKLTRYLEKYKINIIVFSNILSKQENNLKANFFEGWYNEILKFKGYIGNEENIYDRTIHILNGKKVIEYMQYEILEYILSKQDHKVSNEDVYFLIKKDSKLDLEFLNQFVENSKTVNIITNDIERFKSIQENLYERENILIGVSNNKNKGLRRAKYIFNVNMTQKDLEKFKINTNAILIHIKENIGYYQNSFDGININDIKLMFPDEYIEEFEKIYKEDINSFDFVKIYESKILQKIYKHKQKSMISSENNIYKMDYKIASDIIKNDEVKIIGLIGNRGEIIDEELTKLYMKNIKNNIK